MTTIGLLSDLHLEFGSEPHIVLPDTDVLILAGDVIEAQFLEERMSWSRSRGFRKSFHRLMGRIRDKGYKLVIAIAGNHEYYHATSIADATWILRSAYAKYGIVFLDCNQHDFEGIKFFGCTLWSDFNGGDPYSMKASEDYMNDFRAIPNWTAENAWRMHQTMRIHIEDFLGAWPHEKKVVITHHSPSFKSMDPKYMAQTLVNGAYMSDLDDLVKEVEGVWCHGHLHYRNFYNIGETTVMCNPVGYHGYEGMLADPRMVIEL